MPEPYNSEILRLLFTFAHWHGLAKLRMHTEATLAILDEETTILGDQLRHFESDTCATFTTRELKREAKARERHMSTKSGRRASSHGGGQRDSGERRSKSFNLQTYKFHSLGDYVSTIKRYGTTDSYTTALVSCLPIPCCVLFT
jgi:hypothetical protein